MSHSPISPRNRRQPRKKATPGNCKCGFPLCPLPAFFQLLNHSAAMFVSVGYCYRCELRPLHRSPRHHPRPLLTLGPHLNLRVLAFPSTVAWDRNNPNGPRYLGLKRAPHIRIQTGTSLPGSVMKVFLLFTVGSARRRWLLVSAHP